MGPSNITVATAPPGLRQVLLRLLALTVLLPALAAAPAGPAARAATATDAPTSATTTTTAGFERGVPPTKGEDFPRMPRECYESDGVTVDDKPCRVTRFGAKRPTLVAWGDSHAWMYLPALRREARRQRVNLTMIVLGSCPVALPLPASRGFGRSGCENRNLRTLSYLRSLEKRSHTDVSVLVGGFWSGYRDAYRRQRQADRTGTDSGLSDYQRHMSTLAVGGSPRMFERLGRMKIDVDLIGQAATVPIDPQPCEAGREPYQCDLPREAALDREQATRRWITRNLRVPLTGRPSLIDATPAYCTATTCRAHVGGVNTYYDDIHLGARLAKTLTGYFRPVLRDLR